MLYMKKFSIDMGFAQISGQADKKLQKEFRKALLFNKRIFRKNPEKFRIIICETEKDFRKMSRCHYQKWASAVVLNDSTLVMRNPRFILSKGKWKRKDIPNIVRHEMCHVFWINFYKTWSPYWLAEGLPCHVGGNYISTKIKLRSSLKNHAIGPEILDYRYLKRNFSKGAQPRYMLWANFTRYLTKKYSTKKLIKFMEEFSRDTTRKKYEVTFKKIFGKTDKQLFKEFLEKIN